MMRRKKKLVSVFIVLISIVSFLLCPNSVFAYSLGDSDYGSNWDYHSQNHHSSSSNVDNSFTGMIVLAILILYLIHFIRKNYRLNKKIKDESKVSLNKEYVKKEEEIKKVIPDFNLEEFKNIVFEKYKKIQIAWMEFDYDTLRKNCTDELYHRVHDQLEELKKKHQKNIKNSFRQITFRVVEVEKNEKEVSLKVRTTIWCYDYIVDHDNHVVKGNKKKKNIYDYEMIFIRSIENSGNSKCPNCGASLENQNSLVCAYCNSNVANDNSYDWLLSKKEIISQK